MPSNSRPKKSKRELAAERERAYESAYASTGNAREAAAQAGYSYNSEVPVKATREQMLTAIVSDIRQATIDIGCTPQAIMTLLWDCVNHARGMGKLREMLSCVQELNRMCGNYVPHQQQKLQINVDTTLEKLNETRKVYKEY